MIISLSVLRQFRAAKSKKLKLLFKYHHAPVLESSSTTTSSSMQRATNQTNDIIIVYSFSGGKIVKD